ncbi:shikimate dehydrogenase substrate binding domain-containing protein [Hirsutella rhossiliensis]|uniref:Shikimate dehydrogenase substrate binding domain-containing protein n=1 Tax=Hirsutella rhossiliensis TaxID=111463 RepID=A0A9P8MX01_9HYPO|nr:shikimate dehydrogenase substrate binding domain-containing protein [Hirsutella rhossiliensis]KAH0962724.1 shikimate dehydrogenase substrate binding domain-containing protein [Hirsutella rhossiliensis]
MEAPCLSGQDQDDANALKRHGYVFGENLARSLSPLLHQEVYRHLGLRWGQLRLDSADISLFLDLAQHPSFYGASITMPNKVAILPHLNGMTNECKAVGACNTVFIREADGRRLLYGANTDIVGVRDALDFNVADSTTAYRNRPALVVGGGGAARSAIYALRRWMGVAEIYVVNRDADEAEAMVHDCTTRGYGQSLRHVTSAEEAEGLQGPGAIVACVPDAVPRTVGEMRARRTVDVLLGKTGGRGVVLDMCYNPTPFTALGALAKAHGCRVVMGTEAMIWQGLEQDRYWTGMEVGEAAVRAIRAVIAANVAQSSHQG